MTCKILVSLAPCVTSRDDFPKPTVELNAGPVWVTAGVLAWAKAKKRDVRDD